MKCWLVWFAVLSACIACKTAKLQLSEIDSHSKKIYSDSLPHSARADSLIAPFKSIVDQKMNEIVAYNPKDLKKNDYKESLSYWAGDAIQWYCDSILDTVIDFALTNPGGLRIPAIPKGDISRGLLYEVSPFDNRLTTVALDSATFLIMLQKIANGGGWPVSNRLKLIISKDHKILYWNVVKQSKSKKFIVALNDYIANGGDQMEMLLPNIQWVSDVILRDIFIDYAKHQKILKVSPDQRIEIK